MEVAIAGAKPNMECTGQNILTMRVDVTTPHQVKHVVYAADDSECETPWDQEDQGVQSSTTKKK